MSDEAIRYRLGYALMRTSEQQLLDLITGHEPVDRHDLKIEAERAGLTAVDEPLERLIAGGKVTLDEAGDIRGTPRQRRRSARPRGLTADQLVADSRRRANLARRNEAEALSAWRSDWLDGRTLAPEEAAAWIVSRSDTPTNYETVADGEVVAEEHRALQFDDGSGLVQWIETTHGGALEALRVLSERLARTYGWQQAQATSFVLADQAPMLPGIRLRTVRSFGSVQREEVQVVDHHPRQEPEAIAAALRKARRREGFEQRRPDDRQGELADFMVGRSVDEESRIEWRRHCREIDRAGWAYSERSAFHTAVERARRAYPDTAA